MKFLIQMEKKILPLNSEKHTNLLVINGQPVS